ncbi:MAG TPA: aldehyde dehydrogenase family protein [Actinomycetota bacterium]|nr:aldehyde dehydrogenase family protein [Actinomycetota bacterium]
MADQEVRVPNQMFLAGRWTDGSGDGTIDVRSPATGESLGSVPVSSERDVDGAVRGAREGLAAMEAMTFFERAALLHRAADVMEERKEELGRLVSLEQGKPLRTEGVAEIEESAENFRVAAEDVKRLTSEVLPSADRNKRMFTFRKPNGVYAVITPWNFPFTIPSELVAPALAGGNAVVFKPSEFTPLIGLKMVQILEEAGFPRGSVSLVFGERTTGEALVTHDGVDAIAFVGSHETGEAIVRAAGLKRTLMELSGNGPQIVLDDANLDAAASLATFGATYVSGQCCVATERVLVAESVHDEFVERLMKEAGSVVLGDPLEERTTMGPLNNRPVAEKMDRHVADARERGVDILRGGRRGEGYPTDLYYELTVADRVGTDTLLFREESFGPVVPITTFSTDDEAIRLANDSQLGLQAAVFTSSLRRAFEMIERLNVGNVVVNDTTDYWESLEPFGGASGTRTGWGRVGGKWGLMDMTDLRTAVIDYRNTRD